MIILYDADCGFCRWTVAWALKRDTRGVLDTITIQSDEATGMLADLDPVQRLRSMHVMHDNDRRESGGAAMRAVLEALPSTRRAAWFAAVWPQAADVLYTVVARNRRHFGRFVSAAARQRADALLQDVRTRSVGSGEHEASCECCRSRHLTAPNL
jgi:predicted DCC family thiol-disulfide oxidoreductase YuxK